MPGVAPPVGPVRPERELGGSGDDGYLVDADGNALPPYALSWRYLGMFLDRCNNNDNGRNLGNNNNNNDNSYSCRKVLWAAYYDEGYQGGGISEYSFYQRKSGAWDGRTCRAQTHGLYWPFSRCRRLDCHQARTTLELVGVFKETDGLYDFTEQLFKHQGYCLWDADKADDGSRDSGDRGGDSRDGDGGDSSDYEFMTNLAENWVSGCTAFSATDAKGNALYYDTKPLPGGDMTYGVYTDSSCLVESVMTWSDVLAADNGDHDDQDGMPSLAALDRWNALLGDYKICQPCRAYNRVKTSDGSSRSGDSGRSEDSGDYEDGDDGEGGLERHGFNCYDDAGYRNCNQCYKFQTQTDMERASTADLARATAQGTVLAVEVDGTRYGRGHYVAPGRGLRAVKKTSMWLSATLALLGLAYHYYPKEFRYCTKRIHRCSQKFRRRRRVDNASTKDSLNDGDYDADGIRVRGDRRFGSLWPHVKDWIAKLRSAVTLGSIYSDHSSTCSTEDTCGSAEDAQDAPEMRRAAAAAATDAVRIAVRENSLLSAQVRERDEEIARQEKVIRELRRKLADAQLIQQLQQRLDAYRSTESAAVSDFSASSGGSAARSGSAGSGSLSCSESHVGDSYSNADLLEFGRRR